MGIRRAGVALTSTWDVQREVGSRPQLRRQGLVLSLSIAMRAIPIGRQGGLRPKRPGAARTSRRAARDVVHGAPLSKQSYSRGVLGREEPAFDEAKQKKNKK